MTQITGGTVEVNRTVKTGDYESKRVGAIITFSATELEDGIEALKRAEAHAIAAVQRLLAHPLTANASAAGPAVAATPAPVAAAPAAEAVATPATKRKPGRPPATANTNTTTKAGEAPAPAQAATAVAATPPATAAAPPAASAAEVTDDTFAGEPAPVTDKDLQAACQIAAGRVTPQVVKQIISKYTPEPRGSVITIVAEKRAAFVKELEGLKPAA